MDLLQLMDKREVKNILKELEKEILTAAELNDRIVIRDNLCSTSSLYRRLTELSLTGILTKKDQTYMLTETGERIQKEFKEKLDPQLDPRLIALLTQFLRSEHSVSDLLDLMKISPNELTKSLHYLLNKKYLVVELRSHSNLHSKINQSIHRSERSLSSSRGRPRKVYRLTKKGKKALDDVGEFEESIK